MLSSVVDVAERENSRDRTGARRAIRFLIAGALRHFFTFPILIFMFAQWAPQCLAQRMPAPTSGSSVASQAPLLGKPGDYVGGDTCAGCHQAEAQSFAKTVHAQGENLPTGATGETAHPAAAAATPFRVTGCETCHGPGKAHADAEENAAGDASKEMAGTKLIFSFQGKPSENSARCMTCHITSREQQAFAHSQHASVGISCNECHAAHLVKSQHVASVVYPQQAFSQVPQLPETTRWLHSALLRQAEPNLCFSCHGNIQAQFALPIHHRVPEGLMTCSDCHTPHGSAVSNVSLNAPQWEACFKCHVEKRGPWVYEHAAVRVEGCVVCHNPHGSTNHFMLVRREGRLLCLQCHTGFHGQAGVPHSRLGFQASGECTRCHVEVHGSNLDANFLR